MNSQAKAAKIVETNRIGPSIAKSLLFNALLLGAHMQPSDRETIFDIIHGIFRMLRFTAFEQHIPPIYQPSNA